MALLQGVFEGWARLLPVVGGTGCLAAVGALVVRLSTNDPSTLPVVGGVAALLVALRVVFVLRHAEG